MKGKIQRKVSLKRILAMLMVVVALATIANPVTAEAKTKTKSITLPTINTASSLTEAQAYVASRKVKTGINYKVKLKQYMALSYGGVIRFVAPKTKTYGFTVSSVKNPKKKKSVTQGSVSFFKTSLYTSTLMYRDVKTRGKKTPTMNFAAKKYAPYYNDTQNYYTTRTGYVKLKKGEEIYLVVDMSSMTYSNYVTFNLKVK